MNTKSESLIVQSSTYRRSLDLHVVRRSLKHVFYIDFSLEVVAWTHIADGGINVAQCIQLLQNYHNWSDGVKQFRRESLHSVLLCFTCFICAVALRALKGTFLKIKCIIIVIIIIICC